MKVTVIMEKAKDGNYSCYVEDDLPGFGLSGFGKTAEAAKEDMLKAYQEMRDIQAEEGKKVPALDFTYKYDLQSFFDYFSFLNVSKVAEMAGINPCSHILKIVYRREARPFIKTMKPCCGDFRFRAFFKYHKSRCYALF